MVGMSRAGAGMCLGALVSGRLPPEAPPGSRATGNLGNNVIYIKLS